MRGSRKLLAIVLGLGALLGGGLADVPATRAATASINALQSERAQLLAQLAALEPAQNAASGALADAERSFGSAQAQVLAARRQLAALNNRLLFLGSQIAADQATVDRAKQQLAVVTRQTYETTSTNSWVAAVLSAPSFNKAMEKLTATSHVAGQVQELQTSVAAKQRAIRAEQAEVKQDFANATALEGQLAAASNAMLGLVAQRNGAYQLASAPARLIAGRIANLDQQIAAEQAPPSAGPANQGSCGNHFAYGQCTWYVATRRCVPWVGNANQWYYNAAKYGYPEGRAPQVGAVVVFWPGGDGASSVGHVGYVEAVGPSDGVPAGYFRLSEMNFNGWNRVNYRTLPSNSSGIQGFIYEK